MLSQSEVVQRFPLRRPPIAHLCRSTEIDPPGTPSRGPIPGRGTEGRKNFRRARAATLWTRNLYSPLGTQG